MAEAAAQPSRSTALAVLLAIVASAAGITTVTFVWLELARVFGSDVGDIALALFSGTALGLLVGLTVGILGARKWNNLGRLVAIAVALALGAGSCGSFLHVVDNAPVR
jgi:hypothetical protein